ncbi:hypothetical protein V6Z12_D08G115000 [Gossypium hirsutum]
MSGEDEEKEITCARKRGRIGALRTRAENGREKRERRGMGIGAEWKNSEPNAGIGGQFCFHSYTLHFSFAFNSVLYKRKFSALFLLQLIACGIAVVATYNEGATDFKETPAYKESVQSRELLEEPDVSNSDVFESNPTEVAPSLE